MRYVVFAPMIENEYDTDLVVEKDELVDFAYASGIQEFAILDSLSMEYLGNVKFSAHW